MNGNELMRKVQIAQFSVTEANLYLDTHPYDCEALAALEYYSDMLAEAIEKYESECGPLIAESSTEVPFEWVKAPFPWEIEC